MATKFSLKNPNPGAWFSFDESDPKAGKICLRIMNPATRDVLNKKTVKKRVEYKHGQRYEVNDVDAEASSRETWDYCIVDWQGLEDEDGKPIPCNTDNKFKLMTENIGFAAFVGSCLNKLIESQESLRELAEKNLSSTSSDLV